jgi:hypothetical protein
MSTNWAEFHYTEETREEIADLARALHGQSAWYQVGHKGTISVYVPDAQLGGSVREDSYSSVEQMRQANPTR